MAVVMLTAMVLPATADNQSSTVGGNPDCDLEAFADSEEFKVDRGDLDVDGDPTVHPASGSGFKVQITAYTTGDGEKFDFTVLSDHVADGVMVKGGDSTNVYDYRPDGTTGDTGLHAPEPPGQGDGWAELSHITFCFGEPEPEPEPAALTVTKAVTGGLAPDSADYALCVTGPDGFDECVTLTVAADGSASHTFDDLDPGTYTVTEGDLPGDVDTVTFNPSDGEITLDEGDTGEVTVTNDFGDDVTEVLATAPLTVEKLVEGTPSGEAFQFEVDCGVFDLGDAATFSIDADGGEHTVGIDIPEGESCTVTETADAGADETFVAVPEGDETGESGNEVTLVMPDAQTTVRFLNVFQAAAVEPGEEEPEPDEEPEPEPESEPDVDTEPSEERVAREPDEPDLPDEPDEPEEPRDEPDEPVTEVEAEEIVREEGDEVTVPNRIEAGGGGLAQGDDGAMGLAGFVALIGGLMLAAMPRGTTRRHATCRR